MGMNNAHRKTCFALLLLFFVCTVAAEDSGHLSCGGIVFPNGTAKGKFTPNQLFEVSGGKSILVIAVQFSDSNAVPSDSSVITTALAQVDSFVRSNSFGAVWISNVAVTPLLTLSQSVAFYRTNVFELLSEARDAAAGAGYAFADY